MSISWTGVKYFSNSTGRPISDHSIQHIYYCSQDRSDEQILSYITKDCGLIFCHVFRTPSKVGVWVVSECHHMQQVSLSLAC